MAQLLRVSVKKVKGSSLVEVLVASVLIIVIFAIASMSLNNIFQSTVKNNTTVIEHELNKLQYLYEHQKINEKYKSDLNNWEIIVVKNNGESNGVTIIKASNPKSKKAVTREVYE